MAGIISLGIGSGGITPFVLFGLHPVASSLGLATEFDYMSVQIGTVDFTGYLAQTEQIATMPTSGEVGRATLTFLDTTGSMPAIPTWGSVVISAGTAAPGTPVWGGFATRKSYEPFSMSGGTARVVTVDCQSYAIALTTNEPISETYGGGNNETVTADYEIVDALVAAYLPAFYDSGSISSASPVTCNYIQFSEETLRSGLNKILERSAKEYGISSDAKFYYRPRISGTLGHDLGELTGVDYDVTYPMTVKPYYDNDAVEIRNAVRVIGGWSVSAVQSEKTDTDGTAYVFQVSYFPAVVVSVYLDATPQTVGVYLVDDPADFDVLVHYDARKFYYQLPPAGGQTLDIRYRYPVRISEDVVNAASVSAIGGTLWGPTIQDSSISDGTVAQTIGSAYLARATAAIERGQISTSWVGTAQVYQPGQVIQVTADALGWANASLEIQAVTARFQSRPGGTGSCLVYWDLDVGTPETIGRTIGESYRDDPDSLRPKNYGPLILA